LDTLGLSPGIKISISSKRGHSTFVLSTIDIQQVMCSYHWRPQWSRTCRYSWWNIHCCRRRYDGSTCTFTNSCESSQILWPVNVI